MAPQKQLKKGPKERQTAEACEAVEQVPKWVEFTTSLLRVPVLVCDRQS